MVAPLFGVARPSRGKKETKKSQAESKKASQKEGQEKRSSQEGFGTQEALSTLPKLRWGSAGDYDAALDHGRYCTFGGYKLDNVIGHHACIIGAENYRR